MPDILLIEDDEDFALSMSALLSALGFSVHIEQTLHGGRHKLATKRFDLMLLDLSLPDGEGPSPISSLIALQPSCPLLVLTGQDNAATAVQSLRAGASDYLTKPIKRQELERAMNTALENSRLHHRAEDIRQNTTLTLPVGDSWVWQQTLAVIYAAARAPKTTVLLTGESGVGKEVAASLLHQSSSRKNEPFVSLNAACFAPALLESEFFGYEPGAFTGANRAKKGLLELAAGGTLFLDEIGELQPDLQAKLLRILEGHPYRRLGGEREFTPNARIICATNRSLEAAVRLGQFRMDLYHRLRVIEIVLPPLRERGKDVERLALHFLAKLGPELGRSKATLSSEAIARLSAYSWPGNVRELRNVIERALVLSQDDEIKPQHLPPEFSEQTTKEAANQTLYKTGGVETLEEVTRTHIIKAYETANQNLTRAAGLLGLSRGALRKRLQGYGLKPTN